MFVSINWIKDYVDLEGCDIKKLINSFTLATAEVEDIIIKGEDVRDVVVGQILTVENHPNSKKLHLLTVDIGEKVVNCVCGAPNVAVGQRVAFAKAGGRVVAGEIGKAVVAGYESEGMCCSEAELGISDDKSGLMSIESDAPCGTDLKEIYPIDDIIFEVDNKSLTNRPDLWGHYGIARAQMFFDNKVYYDFVDRCREAGINVPIIPGLKPLSTARQVSLLPESFSLDIPVELTSEIAKAGEDKEAVYRIGTEWCTMQCRDLIAHGVPAVHFYTMGKSKNITDILRECF